MPPYHRIGITVKSDLGDRDAAVAQLLAMLRDEGVEVCIDARRSQGLASAADCPTFDDERGLDLLIVIGGDGTILRAVRELTDFSVPLLTINRGEVGFLAELTLAEIPKLLPDLLGGGGVVEERTLLRIEAKRGATTFVSGFVLNEAVIAQGSIARLINLATTVNGEELTTYRADGLIIATPTGSTAYSLAAGGPIVHPGLDAIILTPVNAHTFTQKPVVIPGDQTVEVEVLPKSNKFGDIQVSLTLDGQAYYTLERGDRIVAGMHGETVKFLRRKKETFYGTLREKLKWGERPAD